MRLLKSLALTLLVTFAAIVQAAAPVLVRLKPPCIEPEMVSLTASCDRPRRTGGVNISVENIDNKLILNCYGHGGFGFTTLFGSIQDALSLLMSKEPNLQTPIRIIGSGCMGLTMAVELRHRGFTNVSISTKDKYNIPSWRAGGFFDPGTGNESSPTDQYHVKLGLDTYAVLYAIEQGKHPYLTKNVVQRMPIYYPADIEVEVEVLERLNLMPASELVTLDFGNGVVHEGYKKQLTYFINVTELMNQLWAQVKALQIPLVEEEVRSFADCAESIICNCTGLGSQELNADTNLVPTRGHFFMLKAQTGQAPLDYMVFAKVMQNDRKETVYFFPKPALRLPSGEQMDCAGMLGGTFIPCKDLDAMSRNKLDEVEFAKLAERSQQYFYGNVTA